VGVSRSAIEVGGPASSTPIAGWRIAPAGGAGACQSGGEEISAPDYSTTSGWLDAAARSTVIAALIAGGRYPQIERSTNLRDLVDPADFAIPWWYRGEFVAHDTARTTMRIDGVLHKADLFVNGQLFATASEIAGAYAATSLDITEAVKEGLNAFALRAHPGDPFSDLTINWWDWNQAPPGHDLGLWRDVLVERTGSVRLELPLVTSSLGDDLTSPAELTITLDAANLTDGSADCEFIAIVSGHGVSVALRRSLTLAAGEVRVIAFATDEYPELRISNPALWWPIREGPQDRYLLEVRALVDGLVSDERSIRFGVRTVTSTIEHGGGRRFQVNGRPIEIIGGGWSPDLFLRSDHERVAAELSYAADLGHNAIRLEGKLENPEFFEMTDAAGILVLAGWECCSRWEEKGPQGSPWTDEDDRVAERSMASAAMLLRHHPSVIGFLIGSDFAPPPKTARLYVDTLRRCRWNLPIISAATAEPTDAAGPSGMKMTGPYSWVPPCYWYDRDAARGGAIGFNSETSSGATIPRQSNLVRFLSDEDLAALWTDPDAKQFHAGPPSEFDNLSIFLRALAGRYGTPRDLRDFARKAQLANYEGNRAQFEAYRSRAYDDEPATGVIYWLFNSAWPSLNWQLHDWYLDPGGAYYGAKKGCERLHAFYAYDDTTIRVANHGRADTSPLELVMNVVAVDGTVINSGEVALGSLPGRSVTTLDPIGSPAVAEPTYFVALELRNLDGGDVMSRNFYWLSLVPDVLDWGASTWQYTPTTGYADLTGLERLATGSIEARVDDFAVVANRCEVRLRLKNSSEERAPLVGIHAAFVFDGTERPQYVPVFWSDNEISLFAGEEAVLAGRCERQAGTGLGLEIDAFNLAGPIHLPL
jgi:exo-1,4-beta-D-glucosaminidase